MADVEDGFHACPLPNFEILDLVADFDDDTGTLVAGAFRTQCGHLGHGPVVEHVVDIGEAESGAVELYEDFVWACTHLN